jgi:hypothetical protein
MKNDPVFSTASSKDITAPHRFPPLELVTSPAVDTEAAAFYLNRKPQTLRVWACKENGPLRPIRVNKRLAWLVSELRKTLSRDAA